MSRSRTKLPFTRPHYRSIFVIPEQRKQELRTLLGTVALTKQSIGSYDIDSTRTQFEKKYKIPSKPMNNYVRIWNVKPIEMQVILEGTEIVAIAEQLVDELIESAILHGEHHNHFFYCLHFDTVQIQGKETLCVVGDAVSYYQCG